MLLRHVKPHAGKLLVQLTRRVAAVVGEKEVFLILIVQPLDEFGHTRKNTVAVIDHAVHIAEEALFFVKIDGSERIHKIDLPF